MQIRDKKRKDIKDNCESIRFYNRYFNITTNGVWNFAVPLNYGNIYDVTVSSQPTGQTCVVANPTGMVYDNVLLITSCTNNLYIVGGNVSGLSGTIILQNNFSDDLTINTDGLFIFSSSIPHGSSHNVTVLSQPTGQTCVVSNSPGVVNAANISDISVNCAMNTYTVGGNISGLNGTLVLRNNNEDDLTLSTNGSYTFSSPVAHSSNYDVTILNQPLGQTCNVTNNFGTINAASISNINISCTNNLYTIGGNLSGLNGTVVLQNNGGNDLILTSNGSFTFSTSVLHADSYNVTVLTQPTGQNCAVTNGSDTVNGINVTNIDINCGNETFTVGGTISGLSGTLELRNNDTDDLSINTNGPFIFATAIPHDSSYDISVLTQPTGQTCTITNKAGIINAADITDVSISCTNNLYFIGGVVSGLSGTLILQNNGGDDLTIATNGAFTFDTALLNSSSYEVTVLNQPNGQTCTVTNGFNTVNGVNVTDIDVSCANNLYTVGGTLNGLSGTVVLQNNEADDLTLDTDGDFTFLIPIPHGDTYEVAVLTKPANPSQTCTITNDSGTINADNITNITIDCVIDTFTIGGTVTSLNGTLVIQNNNGDDLTINANGPFTFSTALDDMTSYDLTVLTQPTNQHCAIANGSNALTSQNVTDISIICASQLNWDTWTTGTAILSGEEVWFYFDVTSGNDYAVSWDDKWNGTGVHTADIKVTAFHEDKATLHFDTMDYAYMTSKLISASSTEKVYLKVETYSGTEEGSFSLKATQVSNSPLSMGTWTTGNSIVAGEVQIYYFDATMGGTYEISWDDLRDGTVPNTVDLRVSAFQQDKTTLYFSGIDHGYSIPQYITAPATERIYIKVEGYEPTEAGSFSLRISQVALGPLTLDAWTTGTLAAGEVHLYYFDATADSKYAVSWDDSIVGSGSYNANIKVSSFYGDKSMFYFSKKDSAYFNSQPIHVANTDQVYIKVEGATTTEAGTYSLKASEMSANPLILDTWTAGTSITTGEVQLYYFDATAGDNYAIYLDDSKDGSGSATGDIRVSVYQENLTDSYFLDIDSAYALPEYVVARATERIYIKVDGIDPLEAGSFSLKASQLTIPQLTLSSWSAGNSLIEGEVQWFYFDALGGWDYEISWDDIDDGSGSHTANIKISAFTGDMRTAYFTDVDAGYSAGQVIPVGNSQKIYLKAETLTGTEAGSFSIRPTRTTSNAVPLSMDTWTVGSTLATGDVHWYYFDGTLSQSYNIQWDDLYEGTETYTSDILVTAFQADQITPYFTDADDGYLVPQNLTAVGNERIYIKVQAWDDKAEGTYSLKFY